MSDDLPNSAVLAKIALKGPDGNTETVWAEPMGSNRYRLMNVPFIAFGLSIGDVVTAKGHRGPPIFEAVVKRGGHSTYRIARQDGVSDDQLALLLRELRDLGCGVERFTPRTYGVDVPPKSDIYATYRWLEEGMARGTWWFDEVHVGHALDVRPASGDIGEH
jgi:hypothetical protein